jgi:hypothetical protein
LKIEDLRHAFVLNRPRKKLALLASCRHQQIEQIIKTEHLKSSIFSLQSSIAWRSAVEQNTIYGAGMGLFIQILLDREMEFYPKNSCIFVWLKVLDKAWVEWYCFHLIVTVCH